MHKFCKFFGIGLHFTMPHHHTPPPHPTTTPHHTPPPHPTTTPPPHSTTTLHHHAHAEVLPAETGPELLLCVLPVQVLLTGSSPLVQSSGRLLVRGGAGVEVAAAQNITLRSTTGGIHFTAHKLQPDVVCAHVFKVGLIVEGHGVKISVGSCLT